MSEQSVEVPRFVATVENVTEVSISGTADWRPWREHLAVEDLTPRHDDQGRAEVRILACSSRYKRLAFRECSIAVTLAGDAPLPSVFLLRAYNSRRCFAWSERSFFGTPYEHADVQVGAQAPAGFSVAQNDVLLEARRGPGAPSPEPGSERDETICIYIPRRPRKQPRLYYASLRGPLIDLPFAPGDEFQVRPPSADHPLALLQETSFRPVRWSIGTGRVHARTNSYHR